MRYQESPSLRYSWPVPRPTQAYIPFAMEIEGDNFPDTTSDDLSTNASFPISGLRTKYTEALRELLLEPLSNLVTHEVAAPYLGPGTTLPSLHQHPLPPHLAPLTGQRV